jgi:hypothetical protein
MSDDPPGTLKNRGSCEVPVIAWEVVHLIWEQLAVNGWSVDACMK